MIPFTAGGAGAVAVLLWAERHHSRWRLAAKPAASAAFVAVALVADATASGYGRWVLAALVLSALGDVTLLGRSTPAFASGLGLFLIAHLAYAAGFGVRGVDGAILALAAALVALAAAGVVRWLLPSVPGPLRGPVILYAAAISAMVAMAAATVAADGDPLILPAAGAFYLSDLAVARDRFVAPGFANRLWGLPLYYGAQFAFAWSVA